jgi:methylamine--corrinoid protein Co-methyltransferase
MFKADSPLGGPIHIRWGITTSRETLQIAAHTSAAVDANTDLLLGNQYYTLSGPCTEMCLLETAAQAITDTASGRELISGSASSKGVVRDKTSPMEARMMGEAAIATMGRDIHEVNTLLDRLVSSYEKDFSRAPAGKTFQECYDVQNITPTKEHMAVYDGAVSRLRRLGLEIA